MPAWTAPPGVRRVAPRAAACRSSIVLRVFELKYVRGGTCRKAPGVSAAGELVRHRNGSHVALRMAWGCGNVCYNR